MFLAAKARIVLTEDSCDGWHQPSIQTITCGIISVRGVKCSPRLAVCSPPPHLRQHLQVYGRHQHCSTGGWPARQSISTRDLQVMSGFLSQDLNKKKSWYVLHTFFTRPFLGLSSTFFFLRFLPFLCLFLLLLSLLLPRLFILCFV